MEYDQDFDWRSLSKKELQILYDKILDEAHRNPRYKTYVMHKWNVSAMDMHNMTFASFERREKERRKKFEIRRVVLQWLHKQKMSMTNEEWQAYFRRLKHSSHYRNPN